MPEFLRTLNFEVRERTRRAPCLLHGGRNPNAFAWEEDGRWFCFNCGKGGDKFTLIEEMRGCGFKEALNFLAAMAGVVLDDSPGARREFEKQRREHQRIEGASAKLTVIEANLRKQYREEIYELEEIRRNAGKRLGELRQVLAGCRENGATLIVVCVRVCGRSITACSSCIFDH